MTELETLVETNQIINPTQSVALGQVVSRKESAGGGVVGVIVDVAQDRKAVWVHPYTDERDDVAVWYSVRELEIASQQDLAGIGRYFMNHQYRTARSLMKAAK